MKYILVTGANGGLASSIINKLLVNGEYVIGLDITEPVVKENYLGIKTDITNDQSVNDALTKVKEVTSYLDVIINTAGIMTMGSLIEEKPEVLERMININFLGMARVNYFFFPLIEKNKGRIINFSSEYGKYTTVPFNAFYTTTKHAVESYSDGLRRELNYLGIKVITIRPGAFKTNMQKSSFDVFDNFYNNSTHYKSVLKKLYPMIKNGTKNAKDADVLAKVLMKAIYKKKPKIIYKKNHELGVKFLSCLPSKWIDSLFFRLFRIKKSK